MDSTRSHRGTRQFTSKSVNILTTHLTSRLGSKTVDYEDAIAPGNGEGMSRFGMSNKSQTPSESSRLK